MKIMTFPNSQYDVVLINPPAENVIEEYDQPEYPAIGIAYLGSYLQKHSDVIPALIDARLGRMSIEATVEQVAQLRPKIVGISSFTHTIIMAVTVAQKIRRLLPDTVLVLGGFHATFLPEKTIDEFSVFDYLVVGEGEIAFTKFVEASLSGKSCDEIPGIWRQNKGKIIQNGRGEIPSSMDELDSPGWNLFDQEIMQKYCRVIPVMTQRGCPFGCNFCSRPYGRKVRRRTNSMVVDEIRKSLCTYPINRIDFYDETFSVYKNDTKDLCRKMIKNNIKTGWTCTTHVNTVDEELVDLMKKSGCSEVRFGVESGNQKIIESMNKNVTKKRILEVHKMFKNASLPTMAFFIFGHPNETLKTVRDTVRFAVRLNADRTAIGIMVPYPGTKVWDMALEGKGGYRKLSVKWNDYNKQLGNAVELESISRKQLEMAQIICYALIFLVNFRFKDFIKIFSENYRLALAIVKKIIWGKVG